MPTNFPSSPANNDTYTYGAQTWYWANQYGVWQSNNISLSGNVDSQYTWNNTQSFANSITFGNSTVNSTISYANASFQNINLQSNTNLVATFSTALSSSSVIVTWPTVTLDSTTKFCVEFFVKFSALTGSSVTYFNQTGVAQVSLGFSTAGCYVISNGYGQTFTPFTLANGVWYHIAYYATGGVAYWAVNGVAQSTGMAGGYSAYSTIGTIDMYQVRGQATFSNLRIVSGANVYSTAGFTPPTSQLTAIASTYLLTLQNSTFIDNSGSNRTITTTGSPLMSPEILTFPGATPYVTGNLNNGNLTTPILTPTYVYANGSLGANGQVLSANSIGGIYWATPITNTTAQYTFSNTITFSNSVLANTINAASYTVGALFTANATLVNTAAINITGQTNTATLFVTTSANLASSNVYVNTAGIYVTNTTGVVNAAVHQVGALFTANSTLVNAAAINITGQVNTGTMFVTTSANLASSNVYVNTAGIYVTNTTGVVNAAVHQVGALFTANSTLVNAAAINITNQTNTATLFVTTSANLASSNVYVNTAGIYVTNTSGVVNAAVHQVGSLFTANSTLVNAAAINITGQTNTATLFVTTSANLASSNVYVNTAGIYVTNTSGVVNAAVHSVGTTFIANSTQLTFNGPISANGASNTGTAGQVLTSGGAGANVYWSTSSGGGGSWVGGTMANTAYFSNTAASGNATSGAVTVLGGVGVANNVYVGGRVGFSNSTNISVVYQQYNATTDSLDVVFG